jgi:hypothetical protein
MDKNNISLLSEYIKLAIIKDSKLLKNENKHFYKIIFNFNHLVSLVDRYNINKSKKKKIS